ncbi:hypothetical protein ABZU32_39065 [Sphaerisporangium sp. NPDC005288]|uniref:hypothetical protein n=1 Tax=Sphaerisporangium sp. NPDC005288 TaxID=3155114 RepID=UPI0033B0B231
MTDEPKVVYVITDLDPKPATKRSGWEAFREALRPTLLISTIAVPVLMVMCIPVGLVLGWSPFVLFCALIVGWPVLVNLVDLMGARLGWPPLHWVASQILARRTSVASKETTNG